MYFGLTNAGGVDQVTRNGDFYGVMKKIKKIEKIIGTENKGSNGIFHILTEEMKVSLLMMAEKDADETRVYDRSIRLKQSEEKQKKQELLKKNNMRKASEHFIDALYYFEMFKSEACWMTASIVNIELK